DRRRTLEARRRTLEDRRRLPIVTERPPLDRLAQRTIIEHIRPSVDNGRFPIKRTPGEAVVVRADIFADGHDVIVAVLRDRHVSRGNAEIAEDAENSNRYLPMGEFATP